jgi:NADH:ubiquinone reductase (H+-translocating)
MTHSTNAHVNGRRAAKGGTLILGGGFGGAYVARLLGKEGATIVSPDSSMLYTPLLPEVAAGAIEPRHVVVPLRQMCPQADVIRGRAVALDEAAQVVQVETEVGTVEVSYERLVLALGAVPRELPIPGLAEHTLPFKVLGDAIQLRNHILRQIDLAEADTERAEQHLTFVFVGAGYAGVEALAELTELVEEAVAHYPGLADVPRRWLLVDAGPKILAEVPDSLSNYTATLLQKRGVDIRLSTTVESVEPDAVTLSDGARVDTSTVVWTAGIRPHPLVEQLGMPTDERHRVMVDEHLLVEGRTSVWALGDCARVPNGATPDQFDPPTCQHALRQSRRLAKTLKGKPKPYHYRSLGAGATLGRDKGIANVFGMRMRGFAGSFVTRSYHLYQLPLRSRRIRVLTDGLISSFFKRDIAEIGAVELQFSTRPLR